MPPIRCIRRWLHAGSACPLFRSRETNAVTRARVASRRRRGCLCGDRAADAPRPHPAMAVSGTVRDHRMRRLCGGVPAGPVGRHGPDQPQRGTPRAGPCGSRGATNWWLASLAAQRSPKCGAQISKVRNNTTAITTMTSAISAKSGNRDSESSGEVGVFIKTVGRADRRRGDASAPAGPCARNQIGVA